MGGDYDRHPSVLVLNRLRVVQNWQVVGGCESLLGSRIESQSQYPLTKIFCGREIHSEATPEFFPEDQMDGRSAG